MATVKVTRTKDDLIKIEGTKEFTAVFNDYNAALLVRDIKNVIRKRAKEIEKIVQE